MARRIMETLTESMYYVLMAFQLGERCGTDIADFVDKQTRGRVNIGPGTLYTLLSKFMDEGLIIEVAVAGRKRTYQITAKGNQVFSDELNRLKQCVLDGESVGR